MVSHEAWTAGKCSQRTSSLRGGYCHGAGRYGDTWVYCRETSGGIGGIVLRKGGDIGRRGVSGEMVAV